MNDHPTENDDKTGRISSEALMATICDLARAWAYNVEDMQPLAAQQFVASRVNELLAGLSACCGTDLAGKIAAHIERSVWSMYDRRHRRAGA